MLGLFLCLPLCLTGLVQIVNIHMSGELEGKEGERGEGLVQIVNIHMCGELTQAWSEMLGVE